MCTIKVVLAKNKTEWKLRVVVPKFTITLLNYSTIIQKRKSNSDGLAVLPVLTRPSSVWNVEISVRPSAT